MSDVDTAALRALVEKATKGKWDWDRGLVPPDGPHRFADIFADDGETIIANFNDLIDEGLANANLIIAAKNVLPSLLDEVEALRETLKRLYQGYVNTLELGRDRIIALGGTCDAVDVMEEGDPALRAARAALGRSKP